MTNILTSTQTIQNNYPQIHEVLETFANIQERYSSSGANDSEIDNQFQDIVMDAIDGKPFHTVEWALFSNIPSYEDAMKALNEEALIVYNTVRTKLSRLRKTETKDTFIKAIRECCWRVCYTD